MAAPMGVGVVGAGRFGEFCVGLYGAMREVEVVAIADTDIERARAIAPPGARVYADHRALVADPRVHVVAVNTPPSLHATVALDAVGAGRHVFVEKPLATRLEDAEEVALAASSRGVRVGVDYVLRHHPLHRLAMELTRRRLLGPFRHWALENFASASRLPAHHWFWEPRVSGGIHVEHGVHFLDLCRQLSGRGRPDRVWGTEQQRADGRIDRASATLRYGAELLATFYHSFDRTDDDERTTLRLAYEAGWVRLDGWIPTRLAVEGAFDDERVETLRDLLGPGTQVETFTTDRPDLAPGTPPARLLRLALAAPDRAGDYRRAVASGMRDLVAAIRGEREPEVSVEDAVESLRLAVLASSADGGSG